MFFKNEGKVKILVDKRKMFCYLICIRRNNYGNVLGERGMILEGNLDF